MGRKINKKLVKELTGGDLEILLKYIKSHPELRLEVRTDGKAFVYYRKGKALEIGLRSFNVDEEYVKNTRFQLPDAKLAKTKPEEYFSRIKEIIDKWVVNIKKRSEFDTQQNIARDNQDKDYKYIIIDMEYNFSQAEIEKEKRKKRAGFDLLGIERKTNKIVFFEVKKGGGCFERKIWVEKPY
jgi:protein subunit release factor A